VRWFCITKVNITLAYKQWGNCIVELKPTQAVPLNTLLPNAHPKSLRLLQKMLRWNPSERISVELALKDLYLNKYHNPSDEPVCTKRLDFTFDEDKVTTVLY